MSLKLEDEKSSLIRFIKSQDYIDTINKRVWSWLRINAGGAHKTCKSNGSRYNDLDSDLKIYLIWSWRRFITMALVADWWVTRKQSAY